VEVKGRPEIISSEDAIKRIMQSGFSELDGTVDTCDPLHLKKGQPVEIRPIDFGFSHADQGEVISINSKELANCGQGQRW